jgi:hypothetical protein
MANEEQPCTCPVPEQNGRKRVAATDCPIHGLEAAFAGGVGHLQRFFIDGILVMAKTEADARRVATRMRSKS